MVLIHVKARCSQNRSLDAEVQHLFTPYRAYCACKSILIKEVVLDDTDVSKAILDYVNCNLIANIVVGASSRSFIKNFKKLDVPANVLRSAPEFCSVFVVKKGKMISSKSAVRPIINTAAPPKLPHAFLPHQNSFANIDQPNRGSHGQGTLHSIGSEKCLLDKVSTDPSRRRPYGSMINWNTSAPPLTIDTHEIVNKPRMTSTRSSNSLSDDEPDDPIGSEQLIGPPITWIFLCRMQVVSGKDLMHH